MDLCVITDLMQEIDACNAFIQARPVGSTDAVARAVRVMDGFLAQYKLAHHVRNVDGDCPVEPKGGDDAIKRRNEVVGDKVATVTHT